MKRPTMHWRTARRVERRGGALVGTGIAAATVPAKADPGIGCERIDWGLHFLTPQKRTICDGPKQADGSWKRFRQLWTPAHYVPLRTSCYGTYTISCTTSGGYHVDDQIWEEMTYVVFDHNVLPDEPGWLPPGTAVLR
ncbi:hypothetical protein [Mycobacterium sp. NS-7484]|uniref:CDGP domain-containing protein n=1 Tax=Mycobacterium sp. NS-7484 TaxID=1834161 RepID=UPI001E4E35F7|nr:hypothetical protein [Mycobacterium sp. NS-7484]